MMHEKSPIKRTVAILKSEADDIAKRGVQL